MAIDVSLPYSKFYLVQTAVVLRTQITIWLTKGSNARFQTELSLGVDHDYHFSREFEESLVAGGRSNPFMEPRGRFLADYSGADGSSLEERCAASSFMLCETIQLGVELTIRSSDAESLCNPGPGLIGQPLAVITVELPDHPTINGLLFATSFLSAALTEELATLSPQSAQTTCSEAGQLRYTEWRERLQKQLHDNTLDAETQANLQALRAMAASFHGVAMPAE